MMRSIRKGGVVERKLADDRRRANDGRRMEAGKNGSRLSGQWADSARLDERLAPRKGTLQAARPQPLE